MLNIRGLFDPSLTCDKSLVQFCDNQVKLFLVFFCLPVQFLILILLISNHFKTNTQSMRILTAR